MLPLQKVRPAKGWTPAGDRLVVVAGELVGAAVSVRPPSRHTNTATSAPTRTTTARITSTRWLVRPSGDWAGSYMDETLHIGILGHPDDRSPDGCFVTPGRRCWSTYSRTVSTRRPTGATDDPPWNRQPNGRRARRAGWRRWAGTGGGHHPPHDPSDDRAGGHDRGDERGRPVELPRPRRDA